MPVLIAHEHKDPVVGASVNNAFAERLCRRSGTLRYIALSDGNHVDAGKRAAPQSVTWLGDRFAGCAAPIDCATPG